MKRDRVNQITDAESQKIYRLWQSREKADGSLSVAHNVTPRLLRTIVEREKNKTRRGIECLTEKDIEAIRSMARAIEHKRDFLQTICDALNVKTSTASYILAGNTPSHLRKTMPKKQVQHPTAKETISPFNFLKSRIDVAIYPDGNVWRLDGKVVSAYELIDEAAQQGWRPNGAFDHKIEAQRLLSWQAAVKTNIAARF